MVTKCLDDLRIGKLKQLWLSLNKNNSHAQRGKHRGIFRTHDATTHDNQRSRNLCERKNLVARDDCLTIERHFRCHCRSRSGSDHDELSFVFRLTLATVHSKMLLIKKTGDP